LPSLGLSMIARNEALTLAYCLESARAAVSQIVVADTGSTDETAAIARGFGATVISIPWRDDFSDARNAALARMETDWVLVLDGDEELDRNASRTLPKLLGGECGRIPCANPQLRAHTRRARLGPYDGAE